MATAIARTDWSSGDSEIQTSLSKLMRTIALDEARCKNELTIVNDPQNTSVRRLERHDDALRDESR